LIVTIEDDSTATAGGCNTGPAVYDSTGRRRMTRWTIPLALTAAVAAGTFAPRAAGQSPPPIAAIDRIIEAPIKAGKMAGASVAVARRGEPLVAKSYGLADLELDVPMPGDASFEIGSVTKQFTAASILLLAERGKLSVDDEVTKYLPQYPTHGQRITLRHLLTHTSGIKGYTELPEFGDLMKLKKPRETLVALFGDKPLDFTPGDALVYNNSAYFLLGLIIEKVSGQGYADFVKANLFDRAGMASSYYCSESAVHRHHAHGYDTENGTLVLKGYINHTWPYSAGSLCSTATDLSSWLTALHGGRILSADSYRAMTTPAALADGTKTRYGFGVGIADIGGRHAIAHGGGINGFLSEVEYFPDSGLSIVVLLNTAGPVGPAELAHDIADAVLGPIESPAPTFTGDLAAFAGTYEGVGRGRPTVVTIAADGKVLTLRGAGPASAPPQVLTYRGGDTFGVNQTLVIFERDGGRVTRLRLDTVGGHYPLKRKSSPS
jgi:CubicO group peptidase (beta-lactamase class C family)